MFVLLSFKTRKSKMFSCSSKTRIHITLQVKDVLFFKNKKVSYIQDVLPFFKNKKFSHSRPDVLLFFKNKKFSYSSGPRCFVLHEQEVLLFMIDNPSFRCKIHNPSLRVQLIFPGRQPQLNGVGLGFRHLHSLLCNVC